MLMQFIPGGPKKPNAAIHLGLLKTCHVAKMEGHMSNHAMANFVNKLTDLVTLAMIILVVMPKSFM